MKNMRTLTILLIFVVVTGMLSVALASSVGVSFMNSVGPRRLVDTLQLDLPAPAGTQRDIEMGAPAAVIDQKFVYLPQLSAEQNETAYQIAFSDSRVQAIISGRTYTTSIQPMVDILLDANNTSTFNIVGASIEIRMEGDFAESDLLGYLVLVNFTPAAVLDVVKISERPVLPEPPTPGPGLTEEEIQLAISIAIGDPNVQAFIDGHTYRTEVFAISSVVSSEFKADQNPITTIGVTIYLDTGETGQALVDLEQRVVVDFIVLPPPMPELTEEQKQLAISIAFNDTQIQDFVRGYNYTVNVYSMPWETVEPGYDVRCPISSRCMTPTSLTATVEVYREDGAIARALVDLTGQTLISVDILPLEPTPQPWLTEAQVQTAVNLALNDTRVSSQINGVKYKLEVLPLFPTTTPASTTATGAIVNIYLENGDIISAAIDFTTLQVTGVATYSPAEPIPIEVPSEPQPATTKAPPPTEILQGT